MRQWHCWGVLAFCASFALVTANNTQAQPTYSIDFQGPTASPLGPSVSDADILTPAGAGVAPPPAVVIPAGPGFGTLGITGVGIHEGRELDALSYGLDGRFFRDEFVALPLFPEESERQSWTFSVDEFASGIPNPSPSVFTEGATGAGEASADVFRATTLPGGLPFVPLPPGANTGVFDGNGGATPFAAPGLNLVEPNTPTLSSLPDQGDNLDAWDIDTPVFRFELATTVYYSLDSSYGDPLETFPANTGTAVANGFVGGDVLVTDTIAPVPTPMLYADSRLLGLNGGVFNPDVQAEDGDDLDALVLWENGDGVYSPTTGPYSWVDGETDMLLYSVRRNSSIVITPTLDALGSGLEITEGDILIPVETAPGVFEPGIFINAEALGLSTVRSGSGTPYPFPNPRFEGQEIWDDDLDGLDVEVLDLTADADGDGDVDVADVLAWQRGFGSVPPPVPGVPDGNFDFDLDVDGDDLSVWTSQFGLGALPVAATTPVPEPAVWALASTLLLAASAARRR
ncbi:MAG: hypothetical protein AAGA92_08480 [Planctomycetota bacterium]